MANRIPLYLNSSGNVQEIANGDFVEPTRVGLPIYVGSTRFVHDYAAASSPGENTFVGLSSGNTSLSYSSASQGSLNSALGTRSLFSLTTGYANSAFGHQALRNATSGFLNVAVGQEALNGIIGGSNNIAIGGLAGKDVSSGTGNTFLGDNTGRGITTGSYNTILGGGLSGLAAGLSNNIIIADGQGNAKYRYDGTNVTLTGPTIVTGKFSIGTNAAPVYALDVAEAITDTSGTKRGFFLQATLSPASASSANCYGQQINLDANNNNDYTGTLRAANFTASINGQANVTTIQGFNALTQVASSAGGAKTATTVMGANFGVANLTTSGYVVTNAIGLKVQSPINSGGGITNTCGLMIDSHTAGTNDTHLLIGTSTIPSGDYAIHSTVTSKSYFAGNIGIGGTTFGTNATNTLLLQNGTKPGSSIADSVQIFSVDISAGNASLGLRTETAVVTETVVSDRTLAVEINGVSLKICLKA